MNFHLKFFTLLIIAFSIFGCSTETEKKIDAETEIKVVTSDTLIEKSTVAQIKYVELDYIHAYDTALTLWQIPFIEKDINTKFGNAHIIISGPQNGEPLVLLHGMNASSTMWYPNIKSLSEQYRVYAIDFFLEPGKSLNTGNVYETSQIMEWYDEIFDQLDLKKISLLGASRGGWLALNIALHSQSRVNKIILLSPAQTFIWIKPGPKIINNVEYSLIPKRKRLRNVLETLTFDVDKISQIYIDQYFIATQISTINQSFMQMRPFSNKQLKSLSMPILVLIGDNDIINNDKSIDEAKKLLPNVQTGTIKNAGHFLSFDQPDVVNKRILDFLNKKNDLLVKSNNLKLYH
jgi:pimeloyl-ACP methyl ester carboxylesterase